MAKAQKFHSRNIKDKIFRSLHKLSQNGGEGGENYNRKVMKIAFSSFKKYQVRQKIKKFKTNKWKKLYHKNLKTYALREFKIAVEKHKEISKVSNNLKSIAYHHFAENQNAKSLKALKLYCYRMRVSKYLSSVTRHKVLGTYLQKFKETYVERATKKY